MENNSLVNLPSDMVKLILFNLPINDIQSLCISNKELFPVCNDDSFWMNKIFHEFPLNYLTKLQNLHRSWRFLSHTKYEKVRMERIYGSWKNIAYRLLPKKNIPVDIEILDYDIRTIFHHNISINGLTSFSEFVDKIRNLPPTYSILSIVLHVYSL